MKIRRNLTAVFSSLNKRADAWFIGSDNTDVLRRGIRYSRGGFQITVQGLSCHTGADSRVGCSNHGTCQVRPHFTLRS